MTQFAQGEVLALYDRKGSGRLLKTYFPMLFFVAVCGIYIMIMRDDVKYDRPVLYYLSFAVLPAFLIAAYLISIRVFTFASGLLSPGRPAVYTKNNRLIVYNNLYFSARVDHIDGVYIMPYKYHKEHLAMNIKFKNGRERAILCDAVAFDRIHELEARIASVLADD
ncbi:MAG: hypothetical protein ACI8U3_001803 [Brevundimonas sp.]|jgi:hypothetical protein|uniref:hypothetical protein n=1 Tax=Brevundimonas sp. TaxID=1871086 RepID=UPI0039E357EF